MSAGRVQETTERRLWGQQEGAEKMLRGEELTGAIIGAAIEVHRVIGPGLLESVYEKCLCLELNGKGIDVQRKVLLPVVYKGLAVDCDLRMDIVLPGKLIVEVKAVDSLHPVHEAQILTYMKLSGIALGLLINFNVPVLKDGLKRMILKSTFT